MELLNNLLLSRTFLVGERVTLADISLCCNMLTLYIQVRTSIALIVKLFCSNDNVYQFVWRSLSSIWWKHFFIQLESAKLCALVLTCKDALRSCMLTCLVCLLCSRVNVPCMLTCSHGNVPCVLSAHVSRCLRCLRTHVATCLVCLRTHVSRRLACLRAHDVMCLACLCAHVATCLVCSRANLPWVPTSSHAITSSKKNKFSMSCFT